MAPFPRETFLCHGLILSLPYSLMQRISSERNIWQTSAKEKSGFQSSLSGGSPHPWIQPTTDTNICQETASVPNVFRIFFLVFVLETIQQTTIYSVALSFINNLGRSWREDVRNEHCAVLEDRCESLMFAGDPAVSPLWILTATVCTDSSRSLNLYLYTKPTSHKHSRDRQSWVLF